MLIKNFKAKVTFFIKPVLTPKHWTMKRLFAILAVCAFVACNNAGKDSGEVKDSVLDKIDSTADAKMDSLRDTTEKLKDKVENSFEKTDSANEVIADTMKKRKG
ncbi:MAG: hypothetical protein ICV66_02185 [Chitinophagaceae bacterium]|nr:hypothetical protein [Chitinophagaceae bacterium]